LNLTQIGKFINVYIREDVYQEFIEKYLVEKLEGSNLKEIREFIFDIGKNETEIRDALLKNTIEKLGEVDLVSKIEESNLKEIRFLIHNIHNAGDDPEFGIEILKKVNLIPKIEKTSLNDINMLIYNIDQVGGDLYG
jgi:deoxyhypusine synthase